MAWLWGGRENTSLENSMCKEKDTRTAARSQIWHQGKAAEVQDGGDRCAGGLAHRGPLLLGILGHVFTSKKAGIEGFSFVHTEFEKTKGHPEKKALQGVTGLELHKGVWAGESYLTAATYIQQ